MEECCVELLIGESLENLPIRHEKICGQMLFNFS